jgi:hypothetical protein
MRGNYLQKRVTTGRFTLLVVILLSLLCWGIAFLFLPELSLHSISEPGDIIQVADLFDPKTGRMINLALYLLIGYLLIEINNRYSLIRVRASFQAAVFFILVAIYPQIHALSNGTLLALVMLGALGSLLKSYQHYQPSGALFRSFFCISIGTFLFPQLIFISPVLLTGAYRFQSLSLRSFCAAMVGWSLPSWVLFGYGYMTGHWERFQQFFGELIRFEPIPSIKEIPLERLLILGYLLFLLIISAIHRMITLYMDKIKTRSYLSFIILLSIPFFLFILLQPAHFTLFLPTLLMLVSIPIGRFFMMANSKSSNLFFILTLLTLIALFGYNMGFFIDWTL